MSLSKDNSNRLACKRWYQKHKTEHYAYQKIEIEKIKLLVNQLKGTSCSICGANTISRIILHEAHGKKHSIAYYFYKSEYQKNKLENYVRLCFRCHVMVHWIINILDERTKEEQDQIVELAERASKPKIY